jgi:hypothetical protein
MKTPGLVAPIVLSGTIHVRTAAGVREVEIRFTPGQPITERDILARVGAALAEVRRKDGPGAELFTAPEFFNGVLLADQPGVFELPESFDFDRDTVQAVALATAQAVPAVETLQ